MAAAKAAAISYIYLYMQEYAKAPVPKMEQGLISVGKGFDNNLAKIAYGPHIPKTGSGNVNAKVLIQIGNQHHGFNGRKAYFVENMGIIS
jgi:hypothetical protein